MNDDYKNKRAVPYTERGAEKLYYLSHALYKKRKFSFAMLIKRLNQFIFSVNIPFEVEIGNRLQLPHGGFGLVMHKDTVIGDDAIIFHNVTIGNGGARIGDKVYIGTGAIIIGAVKLGDDVTIGANAVVDFDVPDNSTVVGPRSSIIKTN